ncbi:N-acetyltransferase family protein [Enterococcus sp. LJL120]
MAEEIEITIREAVPEDAAAILTLSKKIGGETDFLVMDETGLNLTEEQEALQLAAIYQSENNVLFVALANEAIVGLASIHSDSSPKIAHIGEIGISILKEFWGIGLGTALLEELIFWAQETEITRRLELTVQARNQRAVNLYQNFGFQREAVMERGAVTVEGTFLDVWLMSKMID